MMHDQDHHIFVSIGGSPLLNQCFADEIGLMSSNNTKLQDLTYKLTTTANAYEKQSSTDKSKVMVNTTGSGSIE